MSNAARRTRRLFGLVFLAAALLMLFAGQTLLDGQLHGLTFMVYWLACLSLVALALVTALIDALIIRHQTHLQQLDLIRTTLGDPSRINSTPNPNPGPDPPRSGSRQTPGANS